MTQGSFKAIPEGFEDSNLDEELFLIRNLLLLVPGIDLPINVIELGFTLLVTIQKAIDKLSGLPIHCQPGIIWLSGC
jgi:hypothetical protein